MIVPTLYCDRCRQPVRLLDDVDVAKLQDNVQLTVVSAGCERIAYRDLCDDCDLVVAQALDMLRPLAVDETTGLPRLRNPLDDPPAPAPAPAEPRAPRDGCGFADRVPCPLCGRKVKLTKAGELFRHQDAPGGGRPVCKGSSRTIEQIAGGLPLCPRCGSACYQSVSGNVCCSACDWTQQPVDNDCDCDGDDCDDGDAARGWRHFGPPPGVVLLPTHRGPPPSPHPLGASRRDATR